LFSGVFQRHGVRHAFCVLSPIRRDDPIWDNHKRSGAYWVVCSSSDGIHFGHERKTAFHLGGLPTSAYFSNLSGVAFVTKYWPIAFLFACHGIYKGFLKPSQKALVADLAPTEMRATIMGTYSWATGLSAIPATAIFGLLWDLSGGWKLPFLLSGAFIALCALLLGLFVHEPKWSEEVKE